MTLDADKWDKFTIFTGSKGSGKTFLMKILTSSFNSKLSEFMDKNVVALYLDKMDVVDEQKDLKENFMENYKLDSRLKEIWEKTRTKFFFVDLNLETSSKLLNFSNDYKVLKLLNDYQKNISNEYWIFSFSDGDELTKFGSSSSVYRLNSFELLKDKNDLILSSEFSTLIDSPLGFIAFEKLKSRPGIYTDFDFWREYVNVMNHEQYQLEKIEKIAFEDFINNQNRNKIDVLEKLDPSVVKSYFKFTNSSWDFRKSQLRNYFTSCYAQKHPQEVTDLWLSKDERFLEIFLYVVHQWLDSRKTIQKNIDYIKSFIEFYLSSKVENNEHKAASDFVIKIDKYVFCVPEIAKIICDCFACRKIPWFIHHYDYNDVRTLFRYIKKSSNDDATLLFDVEYEVQKFKRRIWDEIRNFGNDVKIKLKLTNYQPGNKSLIKILNLINDNNSTIRIVEFEGPFTSLEDDQLFLNCQTIQSVRKLALNVYCCDSFIEIFKSSFHVLEELYINIDLNENNPDIKSSLENNEHIKSLDLSQIFSNNHKLCISLSFVNEFSSNILSFFANGSRIKTISGKDINISVDTEVFCDLLDLP